MTDKITDTQALIVVTGAAGFIGSCMVQYLNDNGFTNLVLVDDFGVEAKRGNWENKQFSEIVERYNFFNWLQQSVKPACIIHLGARTDTTEFNYAIHQELNLEYSQKVWEYCTANQVPLIYASSAATYGDGEHGYADDHGIVNELQPLNPYGKSKNEFDKWVLQQATHPPFWAGLKFFNVYGPNEAHKKRMASVIFHAFNQIRENGHMKLFRSHKAGYKDGEQLRDFVYVKDVVKVIYWLMKQQPVSAIYNLGTGKARSFIDLVNATFAGLDKEANIEFIDMPADIRDKYQYFTEADMNKLHQAGYSEPFYSLEEGVQDYVRHYLALGKKY
ncbi:ADP-glyceromanno-heptose 6-epimerase [Deminuibacter soli]|uniref:ADP-L-glycero-D-manno-heptose-6-epimerase n=1 Tax=Deminuibacter soli TaxID=2291815 RepID=A0A3E1NDK1_9BACT|nr:ADP-glyceromanno-heptose 6-epimerase [Deminuibacter soli]RFM26036.1 ADP-glyceromanno-heptose 6-epimerase [Deminuibacter soli]